MANNTIVENIILGCLAKQPMSGYEIKQVITNSTGLFYNASYGSIYPTLKKHEESGWVTSKEVVEKGRYKKIYEITEEGHREFMEWMHQSSKPITIKYEMLVHLFYFQNLTPNERIDQVGKHIEELKAFQDQLRTIERFAQELGDPYQQLTLQWGEDFYTFLIDWYEKLLTRLKSEGEEA
ncbi:MAG: PadR family transcriptional regulator [Bacillota bacterium]|nr:PadR family transcriptional regulator [Bacillota bacterium]